jgi:hypothetical protein
MARAVESGPIFGMYGLSKVEYLGDSKGVWKGSETCHPYLFGPEKRKSWVDPRDQDVLLEQKDENGDLWFKLLSEPEDWRGRTRKGH